MLCKVNLDDRHGLAVVMVVVPAFCLLGCKLGQQSRQLQVHVIIHRAAGPRSDHDQGETAGADHTVHDGGRASGGSSDNEGCGVLLQNDVGAEF